MYWLTIWLNKVVKSMGVILLICPTLFGHAQRVEKLSLQQVYELAERNYPAIRQKGLISQTEELTMKNLSTGFLPQVTISGQGSYQSDVTRVDIPIPGVKVPSQARDQYRIVGELSQLLYDGGAISVQKNVQQRVTAVEERKLEVELFALKVRVSQLYFGILYQDQLLRQNELLLKDIQVGIDKIQQQLNNGTILRSALQVLQVQALQTKQRAIEISNTKSGLAAALSLFTDKVLSGDEQLVMPEPSHGTDTSIARPELNLYEDQSKLLEGQESLVAARNRPRVSAFMQGGYGRPGLNLLSNSFDAFYVTGVRLNWSLGGLYNARRDKNLLEINRQSVNLQKETFLLNTQAQLKQQQAEITKFTAMLRDDQAIIDLRSKITEAAKAQLENGVITANDYLREINAQDSARQAFAAHQLQLLQAQITYELTGGRM